MHTFNLNGQPIRYFSHDDEIWFVTTDANKAFDFKGENTLLDRNSINVKDLMTHSSNMESDYFRSENIPETGLVISIVGLFNSISLSRKSDLKTMQIQIAGLAAMQVKQQLTPNRLALPSADMQVNNLAGAVAKRRDKVPTDLINLPGWLTVTEMLHQLGETVEDEDSLNHDSRFRHWINRHLSDLYRAQCGEEPPTVSRKHGTGYCYPGEFITTAKRYLKQWKQGLMAA